MRKLATIRTINSITPILKKDRIELAKIDGWQVIVKKGEFSEGDLCVFFEIDSFLPNIPEFSFLKKTTKYEGKEGYRLKSIKMGGVLSQGLALPLKHFDNMKNWYDSHPYHEGDNVTELLNVIKYDNQIATQLSYVGVRPGSAQGKFPSFIPKTDQERIQNLPTYFETYKHTMFEETLKLDGSSMTCYKVYNPIAKWKRIVNEILQYELFRPSIHFGVCSRNIELKPDDPSSYFWKVAKEYNIEKLLPIGYALQGELIGPRIQNNHEKVDDHEFYVFDIYNINEQRYLTPQDRNYMMTVFMQTIPHVPIVSYATKIFNKCSTVQELLEHVEGESINTSVVSEGRVYKSHDGKVTFKAISNKYLLS